MSTRWQAHVLPASESEWHALPDDVFRTAWESMPRVALLRENEVIDADDLTNCLGSIQEIANGFLTRTCEGEYGVFPRRHFATRAEAEAHLRAMLRAAGYRMIKGAP